MPNIWRCPACTLENPGNAAVCGACGQAAPKGVSSTPLHSGVPGSAASFHSHSGGYGGHDGYDDSGRSSRLHSKDTGYNSQNHSPRSQTGGNLPPPPAHTVQLGTEPFGSHAGSMHRGDSFASQASQGYRNHSNLPPTAGQPDLGRTHNVAPVHQDGMSSQRMTPGYQDGTRSSGGMTPAYQDGTHSGMMPTYKDGTHSGMMPTYKDGTHSGMMPTYKDGSGTVPPGHYASGQASQNMKPVYGDGLRSQGLTSAHQDGLRSQGLQSLRGQNLEGGKLLVELIRGLKLKNTDLGIMPGDVSDPFVVVKLGKQEHQTETIDNNLNPVWKKNKFEFEVEHEDEVLQLEVFNCNTWHAHDSLGRTKVRLRDIIAGETRHFSEKLENGDEGRLEFEVRLLTAHHIARGDTNLSAFHNAAQNPGEFPKHQATIAPGNFFVAPSAKQKRPGVQHWVPIPSFKGFGKEAFEPPPRPNGETSTVGADRRRMAYESRACRMGQYDYADRPNYFPAQEEVDKSRWRNDPFYGWRSAALEGEKKQQQQAIRDVSEMKDVQQLELWQKDPFHGWLKHDARGQPTGDSLKELEVKEGRKLASLPSFSDAERKRFNDHREYAGIEQETRGRWSEGRQHYGHEQPEKKWKEDAFFGWLPRRGQPREEQHVMHRPFEQARLQSLPSFSENAFHGLRGKGIGALKVWVNAAYYLAYMENSNMTGKPTSCVKLSLGTQDRGHHQEFMTDTVTRDANPKYNAFHVFEVESARDTLTLEVIHSTGASRPQAQYFLGRFEIPVSRMIDHARDRHAQGLPIEPYQFRQELEVPQERHKRQHAPLLAFELLFEPYGTSLYNDRSGDHDGVSSQPVPFARGFSRGLSMTSDAGGNIGIISVRIIAAYNLVNMDTGLFGDVSDPYVTMRLKTQSDKQRKRTKTINNDLNPRWNSSPFLFPIHSPNEDLLLEVYDDDMLSGDDFIGRMVIPLSNIVAHPNKPLRIRDHLQDIDHGELEVEVGFSPG